METKTHKKFLYMIVFFLLCSFPAMAGDFDEADETEDLDNDLLNPTPIDDYIIPMLVLGVATAFYLVRKKERPVSTEK